MTNASLMPPPAFNDTYSNTPCDFCGKANINKEIVDKVINGIEYKLCDFCSHYDSFDEVKEAYAKHLSEMWSGLFPLPIDYL